MKKGLSFLIAIIILFTITSAIAEEWTCPSCNSEVFGNFCNNCGIAKPQPDNSNWICIACGTAASGNFCSNCGSAFSVQSELTVYPLQFTSRHMDEVIDMPDICYSTPATENGYGWTPVYVIGTVTKVYLDHEYAPGMPALIRMDTAKGPVIIQVMSPDYLLESQYNSEFNTESEKDAFRGLFDSTMDYTLPKVGERVKIYGFYQGYSSVMKAGALLFGLDEFGDITH